MANFVKNGHFLGSRMTLLTKRTNKNALRLFLNQKNVRFFFKLAIKNQIGFFGRKAKDNLFSVRGFEMETSNFALNGCLRASKNPKFHARSKKNLD